jgi:hypothetical protein
MIEEEDGNNDGEILDDGSSDEDITTPYKTVCFQMERNDPTLTELEVGTLTGNPNWGWTAPHSFQPIQPDDGDWGAYGKVIGSNTSLKMIKFGNFHVKYL